MCVQTLPAIECLGLGTSYHQKQQLLKSSTPSNIIRQDEAWIIPSNDGLWYALCQSRSIGENMSLMLWTIETQTQWTFSYLKGRTRSLFFSHYTRYRTSSAGRTGTGKQNWQCWMLGGPMFFRRCSRRLSDQTQIILSPQGNLRLLADLKFLAFTAAAYVICAKS